jgi:hypothetical protein
MFQDKEYITIQEAVELTKKAPNTIRSLVTSSYHDGTKVVTKKKGKKFSYLISRKYLLEYFDIPTYYQEDATKNNQFGTNIVTSSYQDSTKAVPDENVEFYKEIIRGQKEEIEKLHSLIENQQKISLHTQMLLDKNMIQLEAKIEEIKKKKRNKILWIF